MKYHMHNYDNGNTGEIPKVFRVEYWPWTDDHEPQPMVIARYELVEVVEGELPPKKQRETVKKIAERMAELL